MRFASAKICRDTLSYFYLFVLIGLFVGVLGPTIPALSRTVEESVAKVGLLFSARSAGFLIGALVLGRYFDRWDGHRTMMAGLLIVSLTLLLVPLSGTLVVLLVVFFCMGAAETTLDIGGNSLLPRLHGDNVAPYMNAMHFCFGIGATLSPLFVAELLNRGAGLWSIYVLIALLTASGVVVLFGRPTPKSRPRAETISRDSQKPDRYLLALFALFFLFYVGAEVGFSGWLPTLVIRLGLGDEVAAGRINSLFWAAFTGARLLGIYLATRIRTERLLILDLALIAAGVALFLLFPVSLSLFIFISLLVGAGMASVFPAAMSYANRLFGLTGQTTSLMMMSAGLGLMFFPWLMGQWLDAQGPSAAMICLSVDLLFGITALVAIFTRQYQLGLPPRRDQRAS